MPKLQEPDHFSSKVVEKAETHSKPQGNGQHRVSTTGGTDFLAQQPKQAASWGRRLRWSLALLGAGGVGWLGFSLFKSPATPPAPKPAPVKVVTLQPPPPKPPPPPPPPKAEPPPQEPKMVEQTPINEPEEKPEEPPPVEDAPPPIATGIQGDGPPDGFGLAARGSGIGASGSRVLGGSKRSSSRWGWYAGKVQTSLAEALRRHPKVRDAVINARVRVWPDAQGRITRVRLAGSIGNEALDAAITEALTGVQLPEPPPADMPTPIVLRVNARRP